MTQYGMAIDLKRCFGCQTCAAACKVANNLPKSLNYNVVYTKGDSDFAHKGTAVATGAIVNDSAGGNYPDCTLHFFPVQCQHCGSPSCVVVCPTGASAKDEDGIVSVDYDACIGCGTCIKACPYEVRTLLSEQQTYYIDEALGEVDAPPHKVMTVEKCTFCKNLIARDETPACMQLCPGRARYWGDLDDPASAPNVAKQGREVMYFLESEGTNPSVIYLR
ncbi:MAG: 4Fe-4S dicluster domain-containing protein [Coriobacteriales bacterium]|jgi:molybdopterin-containing oxidoreductase family iron-sulfur binding subunit|nr:4Fe-4S dicluster domain-containing protein [Coriobacteriales bacterium]